MTMDPVTSTAFESLAHEVLPALQRRLAALAALPADDRRCDEATRHLIINTLELFPMLREWMENKVPSGKPVVAPADPGLVQVPGELLDTLVEYADLLELDQLRLRAMVKGLSANDRQESGALELSAVAARLSQDVNGIRRVAAGLQQRTSSELATALQRIVAGHVAEHPAHYAVRTSFEAFNLDQAQIDVAANSFASAVRVVAEGAVAQGEKSPVIEVSARLTAGLVRATLRCAGLKSLDGVKVDALARTFALVKGSVFIVRGERLAIACEVPASLRAMTGIVVKAGEENYALPVHGIIETMRIDPSLVQQIAGQEFLNLRSTSLPLVPLTAVVGKPVSKSGDGRYAVVVASGSNRFGLVVDRLIEHRDLSLRPLGGSLANRPEVIGGALDSDGNVIMVIDPRHIRITAAKSSAA